MMEKFLLTLSIFSLLAVALSIDAELTDELETNKDDLQDDNVAIPSTRPSFDSEKYKIDDDSDEIVIVSGTEAPLKESQVEIKQEGEGNACNDHHKLVFNHKEHGKMELHPHRIPLHHKEHDKNDIHNHGPFPHHIDHDRKDFHKHGPPPSHHKEHDSKVFFKHGSPPRHDGKHKGLEESSKFGEIDKRVEANLL
ncbi:hypothetical protein TSAR_013096 [Trichomalopsis sarcophagae]|uniref:Uncharacterized protein n=1 Tax=Trichomalopsis sarcophagae TaxID=543379 RepID=A0A232EF29_9HYME|nr:hypothetical protein TSAR_013096 [Trichomalopsis sarcophagae]